MVTEQDNPALRIQQQRNLKNQISELADQDEAELIIRESSPRTRYSTIYAMRDGEPLRVPVKLIAATLEKRDRKTGQYLFTATREDAPEYKLGEVKCFLHSESTDRIVLDEIGVSAICESGHLANGYSKRIHGLHRHKQEWAMFQEHIAERKEYEINDRAERQLQATLKLAEAAAKPTKAG
jgi:hypothetical protein